MISQLVNFYHSIPASFWELLWSALVLSGVLEATKHLLVSDVSKLSNKTQISLMSAVAFAASGVQSLTQAASTNPALLGVHTAVLISALQLAYTYIIKPATSIILDAKAYRAQTSPAAAVADVPAAG